MINFDDTDSDHGWFVHVSRDYRPRSWWYRRHRALGESPLSALCDGRFEEVHAVV